MPSQKGIALLLSVIAASVNADSKSQFLGSKRKVSSASVQAELNSVLGDVLGQGHGVADSRIRRIYKTLTPMFRSLPKNNRGHISSAVMRYAVRRYFSQNHGWLVKGFNVHEEDASNATDTDILQNKLPGYIRSILEERFGQIGFSLDGVVAMVASLERLVFDEVVRIVELAYEFNDIDREAKLSIHDLEDILSSFLIVQVFEGVETAEAHAKLRNRINEVYPFWNTTQLFLHDNIRSDIWQRQGSSNPFADRSYSYTFEDAVRMSQSVSDDFGSWSNHECHEMKDMLMEMDVHGTGRVKLSDFYSYAKDGVWQFLEPAEQLRLSGTLDESSSFSGPQVMIANYINQMSNCVTSQPYYSICCLNECDHVFQQLEANIAAASASPEQIVVALESGLYTQSLSTISAENIARLDQIAGLHDGKIPLHGRLFARWLHFVYPHECPYPHAAGVVKPLSQKEWKDLVGVEAESATDDEIAMHVQSEYADREPSPEAGSLLWTLEESLLESSTPSDSVESQIWNGIRVAAQIGMVVAFLAFLRPLVQTLWSSGTRGKLVEYEV